MAHGPSDLRPGVPELRQLGASVASEVVSTRFDYLDGPPLLIGGDDTPIPFARNLEAAWIPSVERITDEIRRNVVG